MGIGPKYASDAGIGTMAVGNRGCTQVPGDGRGLTVGTQLYPQGRRVSRCKELQSTEIRRVSGRRQKHWHTVYMRGVISALQAFAAGAAVPFQSAGSRVSCAL